MKMIPKGDEEGIYKPEFRASILRGTLDLKKGRIISHSQLKKRLSKVR